MGIALLLWVLGALPGSPAARMAHAAPGVNPCQRSDNLLQNCSFEGFASREAGGRWVMIPEGWSPFIVAGTPDFRPAVDTCPGAGPGCGAPSLWLISDGQPYVAGVYQQVTVTPGSVYQADIGWAAVNVADMERKLGLDPGGGTDPLATTVVWGRSEWGLEKWPDLTVTARAAGPTMTLFIWVGHGVSHGADSVYFDAPGLWLDPSQPALAPTVPPSPTATRRPRTATPTPPPATSTPSPVPSPTSTPMPTLTATPTETPAPTATHTATPSPVPPTATATRLSVSVAYTGGQTVRDSVVDAEDTPPREAEPARVVLVVAIAAAAGAVLAVAGAAAVWVRGRAREP